ncbi:DUF6261 family protein [Parabacteroides sp. GYB001]|uniref:DUF6261 family protein n=1 Tax=Parabacteroides leei TaxID=2939491 RepID=UPI0020177C3D|nr:DUF6261 family protein [Parabacteroides leei]MCL3852247.1 DUF6261 family protein [Parabacteroides leei]
MKKIPEILYLKSARNAEHYNLQEALLKAVPADFATQYKLTELRDSYLSLFEKEDSIYLQNKGFVDTKELSDKDAARDRLFRLVRLTIQSKELSLTPSEATAGNKLAYVMKPYNKAASKPDAENTAMVSDLVKKLQSDEYSSYVQTLGLTEAVASLKAANDEFAELYSRRADEKRVRTVTENLLQIRPQVDEAARKLFEAINAIYMVSEVIEKDAAKIAAVGAVIDAVNAEIVQFSETLSRRGIGSKANVNPDDDRPVITPDEPGGGGGEDDRPVIE